MNEIKTFKAESMQEALAIVRRELGSEAVILNTRQVTRRRLLPFLKKRQEVEVTAGVSVESRQASSPMVASASQPAAARSLPTQPVTTPSPFAPGVTQRSAQSSVPPALEQASPPSTALGRAAALAKELERRNAEQAQLEKSLSSLETAAATVVQAPAPAQPSDSSTVTSDSIRQTPDRTSEESVPDDAHPANQAAGLQAAADLLHEEDDSSSELSVKLDVLQKMVESLSQKAHFRSADEVPEELFEIYTQLIDADIDDDLARELVCKLRQNCTPEQLHDPVGSRALLSAMVEADIRCAPPIQTQAGRRRVVALVGPTGVGKTTTIAKLAANFRLRDGIKMGLVTVDTYRIAAVEQLRTYAEIIDLPMKVVTSPQEMRRALDELSDLDLILIDTAGRSPRDELKIQELKSLLNEASVDEVHLVMSLTASVRSIRMTCEQFGSINPTSLILTKLDEAAGAGCLLSVSRDVKLPFSYLTTGQDVPEDIEPANANRIARLVLGEDRLFD
jgi:flagellar biosynthesis protein FlhF